MKCAKCGKHRAVLTLLPYSVAKGVIAWLHPRCAGVVTDEEWRAECAKRAPLERESFQVRGGEPT